MIKKNNKNLNNELNLEKVLAENGTKKIVALILYIVGITLPIAVIISFLFSDVIVLRTGGPSYYAWTGIELLSSPLSGLDYVLNLFAAKIMPEVPINLATAFIELNFMVEFMLFIIQKIIWLDIILTVIVIIFVLLKNLKKKKYAHILFSLMRLLMNMTIVIIAIISAIFSIAIYFQLSSIIDKYIAFGFIYVEVIPNIVLLALGVVFPIVYDKVVKGVVKSMCKEQNIDANDKEVVKVVQANTYKKL